MKRFYADVIAPVSKKLACQLDLSILQAEYNETDYYYEFNMDEKLRGDLEQRSDSLTRSAGRPWRTVNEVRASENLPAIEGGDELTIPTNVMLAGDQGNPNAPQLPAPNMMPIQDPNKPPQDGSYREEPPKALTNGKAAQIIPRRVAIVRRRSEDAKEFERILYAEFARQERVVKSDPVKAKAADDERFNRELSEKLLRQARETVKREGGITAARMASEFDMGRTENYLAATARSRGRSGEQGHRRSRFGVRLRGRLHPRQGHSRLPARAHLRHGILLLRREGSGEPDRRREAGLGVWGRL